MGIPVTITGLNQFIEEIPEGNLILVESSIDPIATIFVQQLGVIAQKNGHQVTYITSRTKEEVLEQIIFYQDEPADICVIEERSHRRWKDYVTEKSVLILDSFSYLILDVPLMEIRNILEEFLKLCQQLNAIVIITMERGMLDSKVEIATGHLADGILLFLSKDTSKGIARFIRIQKWIKGQSFDENIYYTFDGKKINVDLRSRVT
jgi:archaellum biogenesis ATPase FlaH